MLLDTLKEDCEYWIASYQALFMNECEIQLRLSHYLMDTKHYDKVYVEYAVPLVKLQADDFEVPQKVSEEKNEWTKPVNFPWRSQMYIDIVVEKEGKFAVVELKYAPKPTGQDLDVFGGKVEVKIEDPGGQNNMKYEYWKDVRRIEALTRIQEVEGGVALIVSNECSYRNSPNPNAKEPGYAKFAMYEKNIVGLEEMRWGEDISEKVKEDRPAFKLDGIYFCRWKDTAIPSIIDKNNGQPKGYFKYMMTVVSKEKLEEIQLLLGLLTKVCGGGDCDKRASSCPYKTNMLCGK